MKQILSDSRREKFAYNEDKFIRVNLDSNQGMLPVSEITSSVNEYHQYFAEHDASNIYRLIFTINPICSNVLFNNITEIVYNEGGDDCVFFGAEGPSSDNLPETITNSGGTGYNNLMGKTLMDRYSLLQDTAYSHVKIGPLVYHCGADIFNNHTLRRKEFTVINKNEETEYKVDFNTISDHLRDRNGKYVKDYKYVKDEQKGGVLEKFDRHLYTTDTIKTYANAIDDNLIEQNGWFGYRNPTTLNIDNFEFKDENDKVTETIVINKCMNNNKAGEFIDMYPDRSLYSFLPKYNKHRKRQEYNWEYCLTYPYENYYDNELITVDDYNGLECIPTSSSLIYLDDDRDNTRNGDNKIIQFKTYIKHNLTTSSKIRIALFDSGNTFLLETSVSILVAEIGNGGYDKDHYFGVRLGDIMPLMNEIDSDGQGIITSDEIRNFNFRFAKYVNGCRCKYYFRKFRKLPNFFGSDIYQDENITDDDIKKVISDKKQAFNTTLNKMAFAENVFSDKLTEIVFNDDINTTGIKDNLGRALSEIYLTIIKTNYGHEKWYDEHNYTGETIEFSHCFGKVTAGLDMENGKLDYNIHRLHNINLTDDLRSIAPYIPEPGEAIENDITINNETFFGDLVELSPYTLEETTLENVYHRFNTAQREYYKENVEHGVSEVDTEFYNIDYDDIVFDDFDIAQSIKDENGNVIKEYSEFEVRKVGYCRVDDETDENEFPGNLAAEGYYYQPHYKIKLREYSPEALWGSNQRALFEITKQDGNLYYIHTSKNYYFNIKDPVILYNKETLKRIEGEIISVDGDYYTEIGLRVELESEKTLTDYLIFKVNPIRPSTAYDLDDGTGRYVWRNFLPAQEMTSGDELYNVPFVNGAHYMHKYINFYLRRQDPYGLYGMSFGLGGSTPLPLLNLIVPGNEKDIDRFDYAENTGKTC